VLVRETPKPGCASEILAYFQGQLGRPTTLRGRIHAQTERLIEVEQQDEKEMLKRWIDQADHGPLLEPAKEVTSSSEQLRDRAVEKETATSHEAIETTRGEGTDSTGPLRILVIGDRLFTDTLLAHRLSRLLPRQPSPSVLSIHTTLLPQPNDVRLLRWVEDKLSKGRLRAGPVDWSRYVRNPYAGVPSLTEIEAVPRVTFRDKLRDLREDVKESKLQWDPRTWTAFDLAVGVGRGLYWVETRSWRLLKGGGLWLWAKSKDLVQRARQGGSKANVDKAEDASGESAASSPPASSGKLSESKAVAA
jgi:phosphatidylglycerophosphatase GEP4